jgi:hypothetical protein
LGTDGAASSVGAGYSRPWHRARPPQPLSFVAAALLRQGEKEGSRQARRRHDRLACGPRYSANHIFPKLNFDAE